MEEFVEALFVLTVIALFSMATMHLAGQLVQAMARLRGSRRIGSARSPEARQDAARRSWTVSH